MIELRKQRRKRRKKLPLVGLVVIVVILVIGLAVLIGMMTIQTVEIEGNTYYTDAKIKSIVGIDETTSIMKLRMGFNRDLSEYPYLKAIHVEMVGLDAVKIVVKEHEIFGYIPYGTGFLGIDAKGVVMDYTVEPLPQVVQIHGIIIEQFTLLEPLALRPEILQAVVMLNQGMKQYGFEFESVYFHNGQVQEIEFDLEGLTIEFGGITDFNQKMQRIKDAYPVIMDSDKTIYNVTLGTLR